MKNIFGQFSNKFADFLGIENTFFKMKNKKSV